jgi:hypothetical protein
MSGNETLQGVPTAIAIRDDRKRIAVQYFSNSIIGSTFGESRGSVVILDLNQQLSVASSQVSPYDKLVPSGLLENQLALFGTERGGVTVMDLQHNAARTRIFPDRTSIEILDAVVIPRSGNVVTLSFSGPNLLVDEWTKPHLEQFWRLSPSISRRSFNDRLEAEPVSGLAAIRSTSHARPKTTTYELYTLWDSKSWGTVPRDMNPRAIMLSPTGEHIAVIESGGFLCILQRFNEECVYEGRIQGRWQGWFSREGRSFVYVGKDGLRHFVTLPRAHDNEAKASASWTSRENSAKWVPFTQIDCEERRRFVPHEINDATHEYLVEETGALDLALIHPSGEFVITSVRIEGGRDDSPVDIQVHKWNLKSGCRSTLNGVGDGYRVGALSQNGRYLALGKSARALTVVDLLIDDLISSISRVEVVIPIDTKSIDVSNDGNYVLVATSDRIQVVGTHTNQLVVDISEKVEAAYFRGDGFIAVSRPGDGGEWIGIADILFDPRRVHNAACQATADSMTPERWKTYFPDLSYIPCKRY